MTPVAAPDTKPDEQDGRGRLTYVTASIADQLFGIAIERVHDVFRVGALTRVPLAPADIAGLLNIRGRVITALDIKPRLGLPATSPRAVTMALGIEAGREAFGLFVDAVGDILKVPTDTLEANPVHLAPSWAELSAGVHQLDDRLLVVLDVDTIVASIGRTDMSGTSPPRNPS